MRLNLIYASLRRVRLRNAQKQRRATLRARAFLTNIQPRLDAEVADGTILMYNFDAEYIHTETPGGYALAIIYPSGDALDKASARQEAAGRENPAVGQAIASLTVGEAHRDSFSKVTSYQHK